MKWTYKYLIFAVDGGSPKRGDSIPLNITFDATCEATGAVVADPVTGEVFFRAPGLTGSKYRKYLTRSVIINNCSINARQILDAKWLQLYYIKKVQIEFFFHYFCPNLDSKYPKSTTNIANKRSV